MNNRTRCCLLVEDDPEDQEFFIDALHDISSDTGCYAVSNGEEALFALLDEHCIPDYIFTDLNMPGMGGMEFLRIIKGIEKFRHIPVIIYSSDYNEATIEQARALSVTAIYSKTRMSALKEILKRYFTRVDNNQTVR